MTEEIFSLNQLTASQLNLALCQLMGLDHWQVNSERAEITCELNLELMEKYGDFKFVTGSMLEQALQGADLTQLDYRYPTVFGAKLQSAVVNPLDRLDKIILSPELALALENSPLSSGMGGIKSALLWPELYERYQQKLKERRQAEAAQAEAQKAQQEQAQQAQEEEQASTEAPVQADAPAEAQPSAPAEPAAESGADAASAPAADDSAGAASGVGEESEDASESAAAAPSDVACEDPILQEIKDELAAKHRYQGRKVKLHFIAGWDGSAASMLWAYTIIRNQMGIVDDGLTDMLRDVIVYEWFERQSQELKASLAGDLDTLYQSLELSDIVFLPDGKSVLWYRLTQPLLGEVEGFGLDIDPPYKRNYAIGLKHVYMGKLSDHPTLKLYQAMLAHEGLKSVVTGVHYTPNDNISPFSLEETSQQMTFINDAYLIFDLPLKTSAKSQLKSLEVLVRLPESGQPNLDEVTARLNQLQEQDLSDFDQLNADIVSTIAEPIIAMKNQQEQKRCAKDPEYAGYTFKDPMHRNEFTYNRLMRQYPLNIERVVLSDNELKFLIPTSLFAFTDKEDDKFQEHNDTLGLVHADAIVVTLVQQGSGLDFSSIDLADCVQIPFGMHQNQDASSYEDNALRELLVDLGKELPVDWIDWLNDARVTLKEHSTKEAAPNPLANLRKRANDKAMKTRERLRQARKNKKKKK